MIDTARTKLNIPATILEGIVFNSRWLLYPMSLGILAAFVVYIFKFFTEDYFLLTHAFDLHAEHVMVSLLGLVDMYMVGNLLVMIVMGSYQIFIARFQCVDPASRPQWLDHVDSGILKVKVASSILTITAIRLLKDFVNIENTPWQDVVHRMFIHTLCLASALILSFIWRLTHPAEPQAH